MEWLAGVTRENSRIWMRQLHGRSNCGFSTECSSQSHGFALRCLHFMTNGARNPFTVSRAAIASGPPIPLNVIFSERNHAPEPARIPRVSRVIVSVMNCPKTSRLCAIASVLSCCQRSRYAGAIIADIASKSRLSIVDRSLACARGIWRSGWSHQRSQSAATSAIPASNSAILLKFMSKSEPTYQPNVAGILRNRDGKILICERTTISGAWQFPQGGIDEGETPEEALVRELWEEISIDADDFRIVSQRDGYRYLFESGKKRGHDGKDQTYFLCEFLGKDSKIDVNTKHPEFSAWKWVAPQEFRREWLPEMKRDVYAAVFQDFFGIRI